ncbi:putative zinc finger protein [Lactococcus phage phiL47]|uniref:Putative zinc finger protein n=1 Tax=Lactococcus phage phiL47 TaxID=1412875 RepID=V9VG90_9CAUD|nr:putative zinc finger protein [Lactococcus phage phiL47]AHC94135.1 putative zinc finger protein [Lactococcus phage phiL47]
MKKNIKHKVVSCTMCEKEFWVNKNIMQGLRIVVDEHLCLQCGKVVGGLK